mgnify:FL=1
MRAAPAHRFKTIILVSLLSCLPGCPEKESKSPTTKPSDAGATPAAPTGDATDGKLTAADAADSPTAPACLPKSGVVSGWTKTEPVRVYMAGEMAGAVTPSEAIRLAYFRVLSAATAAYVTKNEDGAERPARVLYIETETPQDGYGILTCQSDATETLKVGGETRVERGDGIHLHAWQGKSYIRISTTAVDSETTEQLIRLLFYITGQLKREDRPAILEALPSDAELLKGRWLARHLGSLPMKTFDFPHAPDAMKMSQLLGLADSTLVCLAHYDVPNGRGTPNVVWVVQYATNKSAYEAHERLSKALEKSKEPALMATNILPPHGAYLVGTWTAEEESIQYMLPRVAKLLPF